MHDYKSVQKYWLLASWLLVMVMVTQVCNAATKPINYQGYLTQPDGTPLDATVAMVVELWTDPTGGTLLYAESHAAVPVSGGRFFIEISSGTPLSGSFSADQFQQDTWLELSINGELLSPRSRFGAVASSQFAEIAERLSTTCADGEWLGFRSGALGCYSCSNGDSVSCYDGDPATKHVGECRSGTSSCVEGAFSACADQVLPAAESCNSRDDDCNGLTDDGDSLPGCATLYSDNDADGFGDPALAGCLCPSSGTATVGGDCDDTDNEVNPAQASYFAAPSAGGTFDYNCNDVLDKQYVKPVASCTYNGSTCDYIAGWVGSAPECGETRSLSTGCAQSGAVCTVTSGLIGLTMGCR